MDENKDSILNQHFNLLQRKFGILVLQQLMKNYKGSLKLASLNLQKMKLLHYETDISLYHLKMYKFNT